MIHDFRLPTIVIAGAFNPHIFTPQWIANVLFQIPEGDEVNGVMVSDLIAQMVRPYIGNVGVQAEEHRLSVFVDSSETADWQIAEALIARLCEALPHTPVQGLGINFRFFDDDFDPDIATKLQQQDKPQLIGEVVEMSATTAIKLSETTHLNLSRTINENNFLVNCNFHSDRFSMAEVAQDFDGKIAERYAFALDVLNTLYGISPSDIIGKKALNIKPASGGEQA